VQNALDSPDAARLPAHGGPGSDVPKLERLVVAHIALVFVLEDVFLLIRSLVEIFDGLAAQAQGQKGCDSESSGFEARELDEVLLGEFLEHGSEDLPLLGSALNAVAVLLDENVGDVDALLDRVVVANLVVLGILGSEGVVELVAKELDVHAIKHGVANGGEPGALVKKARVIAGNLGGVVVDQVQVPDTAEDAEGGLAVLDHDDLGKTMESRGVILLPVDDLGTEKIDAVLQSTVVEVINIAKLVVETSVTTGRMRDSEREWGRGWLEGIGRFSTLTPRGSDGDERLGKLRRGCHDGMDDWSVALMVLSAK
jgi:hypothetical protein